MKNPFTSTNTSSEQASARGGKTLQGTVVSTKMKDTIVVLVERYEKHPKYEKFVKHKKRFKAHDAGNTKVMGETVTIVETKPISKDKHFIVK